MALDALYATIAEDQEHCDDLVPEEDCQICKAYKNAAAILQKARQK